jgi:hypothetical protein
MDALPAHDRKEVVDIIVEAREADKVKRVACEQSKDNKGEHNKTHGLTFPGDEALP